MNIHESTSSAFNFRKNAEYINIILNEITKTFISNNPSFKDELYVNIKGNGDINLSTLFKTIVTIKFDETAEIYKSIPAKGCENLNLNNLESSIYNLPEKLKTESNVVWMQ